MKYALRQLAKNPGFTVVALVTLALAIGVNTTVFTALNRLLLQALPFRDSGGLVQVWASTPREEFVMQIPGDIFEEREHNSVFKEMAAYIPGSTLSLGEPKQPALLCNCMAVTANFFPLIGVEPQLGRGFTAAEENHFDRVILLSNWFWRAHFSADRNVLGRSVRLDSAMYTIVGVMPPSMDDPMLFGGRVTFWPLDGMVIHRNLHGGGWYHVVARLKPGVTIQQAQAEMAVLATTMGHEYPKTNTNRGLKVIPFPTNSVGDDIAHLTWLVMALSGMVLLIGCLNLANLELVRTTGRAQEIGVRIALGCSRVQLIRMLLAESLTLSLAGGALGILVAAWSNVYVARFLEIDMPLDLRVLGFAFAISLATGAAFGTIPAWIASKADVNESLRSGGRGMSSDRSRKWLRQGLVVVELGLSLTLLAGAGFFVRGIYKLTHQALGWNTDNEIVGSLVLDHDHYGEQLDPRNLAFGNRIMAAAEALPGVTAAAISMNAPVWGLSQEPYRVEGQPAPELGKETYALSDNVTPGYFDVYKIPLIRGRNFRDSDRLGSPSVVIVNEAMARKLWPGEDPIGKRLGRTDPANPDWAEVVGVMSDYKGAAQFYDPAAPTLRFFRPWAQNNHRFLTFSVRTVGDPEALKESVIKAIGLLDPDLAVRGTWTVKEMMADEVAFFSFLRRLLLQISALGLLLAAVGIYGVVANLASERTREIGIRMALGAQPGGLVWLFLRNGIQLALIGTVVGLVASFILLDVLGKVLPVVPGKDPSVVAGVALLLVAVALVACWLPARRITRIDPNVALRAE
jgi:putative ABC transport system permease protein